MGKHYDINLKNKIVSDYFSNEGGIIYLGKKYNISSNTIRHWIDKQKNKEIKLMILIIFEEDLKKKI